ncbi:MAG: hypothetical protein DRP29_09745 [Thermodesulfobacteriota bacterium]|nr:MAG: hypothetical protein DRP29_09745 [Thermodesulfobacteriota bacterium]
MLYDVKELEKTHHQNFEGNPLYVYKDLGTYRILTDGYYLYKEYPNKKGIEPFPIAEGREGFVLKEVSPIDQIFLELKRKLIATLIDFIKKKPDCSFDELAKYIVENIEEADVIKLLLKALLKIGKVRRIFREEKFEELRDFIAKSDIEEIRAAFYEEERTI